MFKGYYGSLYKNKRTRTFSQVWSTAQEFTLDIKASGLENIDLGFAMSTNSLNTIYYLLYSRYANSSIASSDENRFKYNLFSIVYQYGPTWAKQLDIQKSLRELTLEELQSGSISINNHAENPSQEPSVNDPDYLKYINNQNVNISKRSKLDALSYLNDVLKKDYTEDFLSKFKKLFKTFNDGLTLWYEEGDYDDD